MIRWFSWTVVGILVLFLGVAAYVRLAPTDPETWHRMPGGITNRDLEGGAMRIVGAGENGLSRLDAIIRDTPRTKLLAGSVDEGKITYVTRSVLFGFPDYTTVRLSGPQIEIYGRLRFGRSDLGVNAARIDGWLERFGKGG
ncbi:DUF1499 domain-containing protein [Roseovarius sp. TE539]|uniref:DUF1499 domain-containing protein n=1 Tax=Roseovarius sp. TE539 TaxID=2249812 RepID=UPI000DE08078|nr:DUF1499 domain-containing protein [Roseovarius sp. TE539]RBI75159.1 DUF1499 domain-containing protein [Roseovarius sp. TE539]